MALTTNKKNKIIAEWKAGKFKSYYAVAKAHKISQPKAKELLLNISMSNSDIVEAGVAYEVGKKVTKNLVEINAIESAVSERMKIAELFEGSAIRNQKLANTALDAVENMQKDAKDEKEKGVIAIEAMSMLKDHSQLTSKNKDSVMGKEADTQISVNTNIQNNIAISWE